MDEEDEDGAGIKGLVERMLLKTTRSGSHIEFADERLLWDIPGDFYRSLPS